MTVNLKIGKEKVVFNYLKGFKIKNNDLLGNMIILGQNSSLLLSEILFKNKKILNIDLLRNNKQGFKNIKDIVTAFKTADFNMKDISSLSINANLADSECQDIIDLKNALNSKNINLILSDDGFMKTEKYKNFDFDFFKFRNNSHFDNKDFQEEMELLVLELKNKIKMFESCFEYFLITKASDGEFLIFLRTYVNAFKNILEGIGDKNETTIKRKSRINIGTYEKLEDNNFLLIKKPSYNLPYNEKKLFF